MAVLILLVGEQPAPNLLPLSYYKPEQIVLVHTSLALSRTRAGRLAAVIEGKRIAVERPFCETGAYQVAEIRNALKQYIEGRKWVGTELIFNLTGGTKTMVLAAYEVARQMGAAAFYYQTEDNQSLIHSYQFEQGSLAVGAPVPITETLTLDDYLKLYVGRYDDNEPPEEPLERLVIQALRVALPEYELKAHVFLQELAGNVEVDLLARHGNQIAVFEIKQTAKKDAIDQLVGVTGQRTLGTYARRILISATPVNENNLDLAQAHGVRVVVLESGKSGQLSEADKEKLVNEVKNALMPKAPKP